MNLPPSRPHLGHSTTTGPTWESLAFQVKFSCAALARNRGISRRTLQRFFRKRYDMTVKDWLRSLRLKEAYARLPFAYCVKEVSIELGYKQASHFSRDFKDFYGVSPSTFCPYASVLTSLGAPLQILGTPER